VTKGARSQSFATLRRHLRLILGAWLVLGVAITTAFLFLRRPETARDICRFGAAALGKELGLEVTFDSCALEPLTATLRISGLRATSPKGDRSLSLDSLQLRLRFLQALAGGLRIERLDIAGLRVRWTDTGQPEPKKPINRPCWTSSLKLFHIEELSLQGESVEMALPKGHAELKDLDVTSQLVHGAYRLQVKTHGQIQRTGGKPIDLRSFSLSGDLDLPRDRAVVTSLGLSADTLDLSATGSIERLCRPEPELRVELKGPVADVGAIAGVEIAGLKGDFDLKGSYLAPHPEGRNAVAKPSTVSVDLSLQGFEAQGYRAPPLSLKLSGNTQRLKIDTLHLQLAPQSTVDVQGTLELKDKLPIDLQLSAQDASFARIVDFVKLQHSWVDFRANLTGHVAGHLLSGFSLAGSTSVDVSNFVMDDTGWDLPGPRQRMLTIAPPVHIQSDLHIDKDGIHFERAHLRSPASDVTVDALVHYDDRRGLKLHTEMTHLDISELKAIAGLPWGGRGALTGDVDGPYSNLMVKAQLDLEDFRLMGVDYGALRGEMTSDIHRQDLVFPGLAALRGATAYQVSGRLSFGADTALEAKLKVADGKLSDLFGALESLQPVMIDLREDLSGSFAGTAEVQGPVRHLNGQASLTFPDFTVFGRAFHAGDLALQLEEGRRVTVEGLRARAGHGELDAHGTVLTSGDVSLAVEAANLPLERLLWPTGSPSAHGLLGVSGKLEGRLDAPRPSGALSIDRFEVMQVPLGTAKASFATDGRTVTLSGNAGDEVTVQATAELVGHGPYHAVLNASTRRLERYLRSRFDTPLSGSLSGQLELEGTVLEPERSKGTIGVDHLILIAQRLRLESSSLIQLKLDAGALDLTPVTLVAGAGKVTMGGTLSEKGDLAVSLKAELEARSLEGLVPRVERLAGNFQLQASVRGPMDAPAVVGSLTLDQGGFTWRGLPLAFSHLVGSVDFSQHKALLEGVRGDLNGGPVAISGELLLEGFSFRRYDLTGTLRDVSLRIPQEISSRVSGTLQLAGDPDQDLRMTGNLEVNWARYTKNFDFETLTETFRADRGWGATVADVAPLRFDIQLHGNGSDIRVDNDLVHMALQGDLRLTGTSDSPGLLGSVNSHDGFADFRGYRYHISQAAFTFSEADQIAPAFDITADTDARQYRVFVHVFGTPQQYQLQLSSQPSLTEEDVVKLLTIGVTSQDSVANAGTAGTAGYIGDVLWNISGLHDQVRRFIPHNDLIKDFTLNLGSAFIESTGQVEPVAQIESRVLTDRFRLRAQLPLSEAAGKRAEVEYQLDDHLSVQGEWNNDYSDYNIGDFGVDLRARWEFGE
jgi:translocation and assembly module TamB